MSPELTRSRSVLERQRDLPDEDVICFTPHAEANPADQGRHRSVFVAREDWTEMGEPEVVTVTVEPGDLLNP